MAKNPKWATEEDNFLVANYSKAPKDHILSGLKGRTWTAICGRASAIGVYRLNYFTESEILFIKNNCTSMTSKEIAESIGRSRDVVANKMLNLGIVRQENWSIQDSNKLRDYFGLYDVEYIAKNILPNRTKSSIYHQCQFLGLSKETGRYQEEDLLEMLKILAEKLERTPTCAELPKYGLPYSTSYLRCFGSYNTACELLGLDINTTIFSQTKYYYSKNMDVCRSKSEQIITNFLIDNGIKYLMDKPYSSICQSGKCGRKRYDWLFDGGVVVEYFGLNRYKKYQERMAQKIELCKINNLELIQVFDKDILKLEKVFEKFIKS